MRPSPGAPARGSPARGKDIRATRGTWAAYTGNGYLALCVLPKYMSTRSYIRPIAYTELGFVSAWGEGDPLPEETQTVFHTVQNLEEIPKKRWDRQYISRRG